MSGPVVESAPISRRSAIVAVTVVTFVAVVVLFAATEAFVRIRQQAHYGIAHDIEEIFVQDPATGLRVIRPNLDTGRVHTDSRGFRNPELAVPKPQGVIRLAFLGASTTFCAEVSSDAATWPDIVARRLAEKMPGVTFDYVNAAVPGYGVEDARTMLAARVAALAPDVVVYYEATNELSGDTRALARERGVSLDPPESSSWVLRHSLLAYLVDKTVTSYVRRSRVLGGEGRLDYDPEPLAANFERNLVALVETAQSTAPVVALATFSQRLRPDQSEDERRKAAITAAFYMPYMSADGIVAGFAAYNRAIMRAASKTGALLIGGEDSIPADERHFVDSVHFTDLGSARMADRVVDALAGSAKLKALVQSRAGR